MLQDSPLLAVAPVLGLAVYCASHLLASRMAGKRGPYYSLLVGCGCGLAATLVFSAAGAGLLRASVADFLALLAMNVAAYLAFSFGYFNFINLNIASLRIRMLRELAERGGEMPVEDLAGLYNTQQITVVRIGRLTDGGHLIEREGRYYSGKRKFLIVGRIFDGLRLLILGGRGEMSRWSPGFSRNPRGKTA